MPTSPAATWLDLYDWRLRVAAMYAGRDAAIRAGADAEALCRDFRARKDALFATHPQSPLAPAARTHFAGLPYFPYDPALCLDAVLEPLAAEAAPALPASGPHAMTFQRAGRLQFQLAGAPAQLVVYWIDVYGGGLFVPFRDATCGTATYGGGRYLIDTVKGSDFTRPDAEAAGLGYAGGHVVLDFNYAYNPSCAYDARWICPLAPNENRLPVAITAGEQLRPAEEQTT